MFRWGLVPSWADDLSISSKLINARAETAPEKPSFRSGFKHRRCLLPAAGFFEWTGKPGRKQPYFITSVDSKPLVFAGLWEQWEKGPELVLAPQGGWPHSRVGTAPGPESGASLLSVTTR
jgi:putative SOS response-associated peptidase YedK